MPDAPSPVRIIPPWQMDKPWTDPMSPEEENGLAETALLAGVQPTSAAITSLLGQFSGDYVVQLQQAGA